MNRDKKGFNAIMATLIIVITNIMIAIAVAYWMGGLDTIFTKNKSNTYTLVFMPKTTIGAYNITVMEYQGYSTMLKNNDILTNSKVIVYTATYLTFEIKSINEQYFDIILMINKEIVLTENNISAVWWSDYYP